MNLHFFASPVQRSLNSVSCSNNFRRNAKKKKKRNPRNGEKEKKEIFFGTLKQKKLKEEKKQGRAKNERVKRLKWNIGINVQNMGEKQNTGTILGI